MDTFGSIGQQSCALDKQFLIVGAARSGTSWMADVLNHFVPTTHERVFQCGMEVNKDAWIAGEVSFAATPWLDQVDCPIFHQVRHPLKVISSESSHLSRDKGKSQAEIFYPDLRDKDVLTTAIEYYLRQNETIEKYASFRYKIEEVTTDLIEEILARAGYGDKKCPPLANHAPSI